MLQALKFLSPSSTVIPFSAILRIRKVGTKELAVMASSAGSATFMCNSEDDRDQQFANFEAWLTTPTLL